jgi:hypothetical protein
MNNTNNMNMNNILVYLEEQTRKSFHLSQRRDENKLPGQRGRREVIVLTPKHSPGSPHGE